MDLVIGGTKCKAPRAPLKKVTASYSYDFDINVTVLHFKAYLKHLNFAKCIGTLPPKQQQQHFVLQKNLFCIHDFGIQVC